MSVISRIYSYIRTSISNIKFLLQMEDSLYTHAYRKGYSDATNFFKKTEDDIQKVREESKAKIKTYSKNITKEMRNLLEITNRKELYKNINHIIFIMDTLE